MIALLARRKYSPVLRHSNRKSVLCRSFRTMTAAAAVLLCSPHAAGQPSFTGPLDLLSLQDRARLKDSWLKERLDKVAPIVMRREGVDMWIVIAGENNEDPVVETMLPATWFSARRRAIIVFYDRGPEDGVERIAVQPGLFGPLFLYEGDAFEDQWANLREIVRQRQPRSIAVNISEHFPLADGLSAGMLRKLKTELGPSYSARFVEKPGLALGWLETRTPSELMAYPSIVEMAQLIMAEGLSNEIITPGVTTAEDVSWRLREIVAALDLDVWFQPTIRIQRKAASGADIYERIRTAGVILPGDLIHLDFGITYLGLNTDMQRLAYVLRPGEDEPPKGLTDGLAAANRVQDFLLDGFETGRSGNEVMAQALVEARSAGLLANIYAHPVGYHGHGAGPLVGHWQDDNPIPGAGDYAVFPNTAWAIESSARLTVPEWDDQEVLFPTEEVAFFDGNSMRLVDGRQRDLILIAPPIERSSDCKREIP